MKEYNIVYGFCRALEKDLEQRTGRTFLLVPFIEGSSVGFILAKDCTIVFKAGFDVYKEMTECFTTVQKQVDEAVDAFLRQTLVAA